MPRAAADPPSRITVAMTGTRRRNISRRLTAIASRLPLSSANHPHRRRVYEAEDRQAETYRMVAIRHMGLAISRPVRHVRITGHISPWCPVLSGWPEQHHGLVADSADAPTSGLVIKATAVAMQFQPFSLMTWM